MRTSTRTRTATANKNGSRWLPAWRRLAIYIRDGFACAYCGRDLRQAKRADVTLDHLDCRSGGKPNHHESNLVTSCRRCNSSRQDKPWRDYAPGGAIERIERLVRTPINAGLAKSIIRGDCPETGLDAR